MLAFDLGVLRRKDREIPLKQSLVLSGVYIAVALIWLWAVDGIKPSTWDYIGVSVALCGMAIIMFAPRNVG